MRDKITISAISESVIGAVGSQESFTRADDDYVELNFDFEDEVDESAIWLDDGREIGIFLLEDNGSIKAAEQGIKNYLEGEKSALASLAALYPSRELTEKLQRYQNATILKRERYICYFILNETDMTAAQMAFGNALR